MKKFLTIVALLTVATFSSNAQSDSYKAFKVDLTPFTGYVIPGGEGLGGGLVYSLEPKYNITDNIAAGIKFEGALFSAGDIEGASVGATTSTSLVGEYSFGEGKSRPYVGLGLGLYDSGSVEISSGGSTISADAGSSFGFAPRIGYQLSHFRIGAEYNFVKNSNYLAIKAAITIGGGEK